ncbi:helix-turn-helix domain-containing protein [Pseudoduganella namucuonensis]|uniref:AraC-binding-like domain-containing protein n=1 Tax=Pseudoduganella namucuonensis TaxID=1035707 RepID=A0A1I7LS19_9BURK|nr:helix-turn-helix domain-containing protein [Pseudoduganella namucuonensis]SFV12439.1 AraC-binding-like domain-containing protein [Pseudoduganella namucuonensis]
MNTSVQKYQFSDIASWQSAIADQFVPLEMQVPGGIGRFYAKGGIARFHHSVVSQMTVTPHRLRREKSAVRQATVSHLKVLWPIQGRCRLHYGGKEHVLQPRQWTVYETGSEYAIEVDETATFLALMLLDTEGAGLLPALRRLRGRPLAVTGAASVALATLDSLLKEGASLDRRSEEFIQDTIIALLDCALRQDSAVPAPSPTRPDRLRAIQQFIRENLADPELSPEKISNIYGMSRRSLYTMFLDAGNTPAAFLLSTRLVAAVSMFENHSCRNRSVTDIAFECGFANMSHFSRVFRQRFGMSPGEWRRRHLL